MIPLYDTMHYEGTYVVSYTSIIYMHDTILYDTPHYKAGHSGGIIADIMHSEIASMPMWQRIKSDREG